MRSYVLETDFELGLSVLLRATWPKGFFDSSAALRHNSEKKGKCDEIEVDGRIGPIDNISGLRGRID